MLSIKSPAPDCPYETLECSEAVTCALLAANSTIHMAGSPRAAVVIQGTKLERPKVNIGVTLEEWNIFKHPRHRSSHRCDASRARSHAQERTSRSEHSQLECAAKPRHAPTSPSEPASAKWTSLTRSSGTS